MATYALQFISQEGALCGQQIITNHARAVRHLEAWTPRPANFAISILIAGGSFKERTALGDLAVADVFYTRQDALRFVNQLIVQEQQT